MVSIIGEIFMRDNAACNGNISNRLEDLGVEVFIAPFSEWITYSTYRFTRDSRWKNDKKGIIKSKIQGLGQEIIAASLSVVLKNLLIMKKMYRFTICLIFAISM